MEDHVEVKRPVEPLSSTGQDSNDDPSAATASPSPYGTRFEDDLGLDLDELDPGTLWANVSFTISALELTTTALVKLREHDSDANLSSVRNKCEKLGRALNELEEILASYAKHWSASEDEAQPPLDLMLRTWIAVCMVQVMGLRKEAERRVETEGWDLISPADALDEADGAEGGQYSVLVHWCQYLDEQTKQLEDSLPIMRW